MTNFLVEYRFLISYLLGAIPFAVLVPWLFTGLNILVLGSGNPGTSNVYRVLSACMSKPAAIGITVLAGLLDIAKGWFPGYLFPESSSLTCLFSVLGHIYSPFLGFSGGKGIAAFHGAFLGVTNKLTYLVPPILWMILAFGKLTNKILSTENDWINLGFFKIKVSFFNSGLTMLISLIMLFFEDLPTKVFWQFSIVFTLICFLHYKHVSLVGSEVSNT
jgi:acyl-phosphate glycerol 3-phosphate acyltransferase